MERSNIECCECLDKDVINKRYLYKETFYCGDCLIQKLADDNVIALDCSNMDEEGMKVN